jgi:hypothetical protein
VAPGEPVTVGLIGEHGVGDGGYLAQEAGTRWSGRKGGRVANGESPPQNCGPSCM